MQSKTQIGDYEIDYSTQLGSGQFGNVFNALKISTQQSICVKQVKNNLKNNKIMINEMAIIEILMVNYHENVVNVFDVIEDVQNLNIFMELCNGDLKNLLDNKSKENEWFTLEQIVDFIKQIVDGYLHLRKLGIVHRDLKPENILVSKNLNQIILKISDFGTSKAIEDEMCITKTGTPFYSAPETFSGQQYDDKCDVYSLGLIIYQLAYKNQKHAKLNTLQDLQNYWRTLKNTQFQCPDDANVPQELRQLIQMMIVSDPKSRISWDDIQSTTLFNRIKFVKNYFIDFGKSIGQQGKGQLLQCQDYFTKELFIVKYLPKQNELISQNGIRIYRDLLRIQHPNLQKILEVLQCVNSQDYYIIMEKCDLTLLDYMKTKKLLPFEIKKFAKQIATGYLQLKQMNIFHRDLKPQNIVVCLDQYAQPTYKITGLETGRNLKNNEHAITNAGNQMYQAPEVNYGKYDYSCDIFSLGIILYQLHFGKFPEDIKTQQQWIIFIKQLEQNNKYQCKRENMDPQICNLIEQMIVYNPSYRVTWEDLLKQINGSLIKPVDLQMPIKPIPIIIIIKFCIYKYLEIIEGLASQIYVEWSQFNYYQITLPQNMYFFFLQTLSLLQYYVHFSLIQLQQCNPIQIRGTIYTTMIKNIQNNKFNQQIWEQNYQRDSINVQNSKYVPEVKSYQEQLSYIQDPSFLDYLEQFNIQIQYQKQSFISFLQRNPQLKAINLLFKIIKLSNFHNEYPIQNLTTYNANSFNLENFNYNQKIQYIEQSLQ